jgi:hypothetical protein
MFVILLVALFGVALMITLMGLYLSPRSQVTHTRDMVYAPRAGERLRQGERVRCARSVSVVSVSSSGSRKDIDSCRLPRGKVDIPSPYESSGNALGGVPQIFAKAICKAGMQGAASPLPGGRGLCPRIPPSPPPQAARRQGVALQKSVAHPALGRWPRWLAIIVGATTVFALCLFLFVQMVFPGVAVLTHFATQVTPVVTQGPLSVDNLGTSNASQVITRIAQLDRSQYDSADEYDTWAYSACSVASMTEVINAYGHQYRLTDILKVEVSLGAISPELGLLEAKGIDRTMDHFGFRMVPLAKPSLDGVIAVANQGHPVFISFASSDYWPGGHILVVRGGTAQDVYLVDSSRLALATVSRDRFLSWWRGFAALAVPK